MPSLFRFGPYVLFFWTGENNEPVHIHVAIKRPTKDATKIWLTCSGGCMVANNKSKIPERDLKDLQQFVAANHKYICEQWEHIAGQCTFYR